MDQIMQLTAHPIGCICNGCMSMRHTAIEIGLAKPGAKYPVGCALTLNGCIVRVNKTPKRYTVEDKTGKKLISTNKVDSVIRVTKR